MLVHKWSLYNDFKTTIPRTPKKELACTTSWHELVWSFVKVPKYSATFQISQFTARYICFHGKVPSTVPLFRMSGEADGHPEHDVSSTDATPLSKFENQ
jgi:hypothetical protein